MLVPAAQIDHPGSRDRKRTREEKRHPMTTQVLDPANLPFAFEDALNAGDVDAVLALFAPEATMRTVTGAVITGAEALREETANTVAGKAKLTNKPRFTLVGGDSALVVVDWTMDVTTPDGTRISPTGTTVAVAARAANGAWEFTILNPLGVA